jgi:hypothetical protein
MRSELQCSLAELVYYRQLLVRRQAVHLLHIAAPIGKRGISATAIFDSRAYAIRLGLLCSLGALSRDICFDAFGGLEVGFQALRRQLLLGEGPGPVLSRRAVQVILRQLHVATSRCCCCDD